MPSVSPRTQQMQQQQQGGGGSGADQAEAMFEQGFSEMAYNILMAKLPDLVQDVVTFKILDTDLDSGSGVGAFVVMRHDQPLYVPVVLSDNNVKPIELIYHKALNIFLPLSKGWLDEIDKTALSTLGKGVKTPETLYSDVDIRNIVVPPVTGRFSYAAWEPVILADVAKVLNPDTLEKVASEPAMVLVDFLTKAPNFVKRAFTIVLEKNPRLIKHAASIYGVNALREALTPHVVKTAAKQLSGGALWIADKDTTPLEFQRTFGEQAAEAYAGVRRKGYAAKDTRTSRNMAVQEQAYERWVEPQQPGVYILTSSEHKEEPAFVMPNPIDILANDEQRSRYARRPPTPGHNPQVDNSYYEPQEHYMRRYEANRVYPEGRPDEADFVLPKLTEKYFAVLKNGDYLLCDQLVGRDSTADSLDGGTLHTRMFESVSGEPKAGKGFFVRAKGTTFQATCPVEIKSVTTDSEGCRRVKVSHVGSFGGNEHVLITEKKNPYGAIWMPKGANVVYLPPDFIWVPLKAKREKGDFFTSALDLQACVSQSLSAVGAKKVAIKNAGANQFSIDGKMACDRVPAIKKLAFEYGLSVESADELVKRAFENKVVRVWVASPLQLGGIQAQWNKLAGDDDKKDKDKGGDKKKSPPKKPASGGGGGAEAGAGGPPPEDDGMGGDDLGAQAAMAAMQPPMPPPPSPLDMATDEFQQHIDNEMKKLMEKSQLLMSLKQREQQIAGGAPPMGMATAGMPQMGGMPPMGGMGQMGGMGDGSPQPPPGIGAAPMPGTMPDPMMGGMGGDPMGGGMPPGMGAPPMGGGQPMGGGMPPDPAMAGMQGPPGRGGAEMGDMGGMPPAAGGALPMGDQGMGAPGMGAPGMGGMPPGGDPSMGGGMQPGMGAPPPPPMAMMGMDGPNAQSLSSEINPQFLQQASQLQSADIFDAAAVSSLAQSPAIKELTSQYVPNLEKAIDNLGRVMLTLWMQETTLKKEIGEVTFASLEDNLRGTFKSLGDLVLKLSQGSHTMPGQFENDAT